MKQVPFSIIQSSKKFDPEAVEFILRHFEGYIASRSSTYYIDKCGNIHSYMDDDLRYQAEITIFKAIASFHFREPPNDFMPNFQN